MIFGKPKTPLTPEEQIERNRRRAIGLSVAAEAFRGGDPVGRALGLRQQFEQQEAEKLAKQKETEMQQLQEGFFKDPKYKDMAKIFGMDFAFQQRQADVQAEAQAQANQKFFDTVKGTPYEDIANTVGIEAAKKAYVERELKPQTVPADIQKLDEIRASRQKLNPNSPTFDPSYTEDQFRQDASALGVSANLLGKSKKEFIAEYMKQMRTMKGITGQPLYSTEQLKIDAESAYDAIYGEEEDLSAAFNEMIKSATALTSE